MQGPSRAIIELGSDPNSSLILRIVALTTPASVPFFPL